MSFNSANSTNPESGRLASAHKVSPDERRTFAIGDIHGCATELELLLRKLEIQRDDRVVFLGDYVDRGAEARRVIDLILELETRCAVVTLKGNHEAMWLDFLERPESARAGVFILNGGGSTLAHYAEEDGSFQIPEAHVSFLNDLALWYETDEFFFVHAGVPLRPLSSLDASRDAITALWTREPFLSTHYKWEKMIVHGHTPVATPDWRPNRINLDTGCVYGGSLTALDLSTMTFHSVPHEERKQAPILRSANQGVSLARRFAGRINVEAARIGDTPRTYSTLNYNQFGLLMTELMDVAQPNFAIGDQIEGRIGPHGQDLPFRGEVVRLESRTERPSYGIKILFIGG